MLGEKKIRFLKMCFIKTHLEDCNQQLDKE